MSKTVCSKHERAYETGEGCPYCEPRAAQAQPSSLAGWAAHAIEDTLPFFGLVRDAALDAVALDTPVTRKDVGQESSAEHLRLRMSRDAQVPASELAGEARASADLPSRYALGREAEARGLRAIHIGEFSHITAEPGPGIRRSLVVWRCARYYHYAGTSQGYCGNSASDCLDAVQRERAEADELALKLADPWEDG